ncbi:MAG: SDR family oxidoreductase [Planctomycetes bacterium]|nr:SDR family oxidoreductase [Planctomycetota bacterium]
MRNIKDLFDLTGRIAIVTGGAGQLGFAMSQSLAELGANVVIASRNVENCREKAALLSKDNPEAVGMQLDITEEQSIKDLTSQVISRFGKIDVLVNNAVTGIRGGVGVEDMTLEDWEYSLRGGLTSVFQCSQIIGAEMVKRKSGVIVNIGSIYGIVAADQGIYGDSGINSPPNYAAVKGGVVQFTRYLSTYWAKHSIRVNMITPGGFYNAKFKTELPDYETFLKNYCRKTPLGRMANPEDIKGAIAYLASDASLYVTGANLILDGGFTVW